MKFLRGADAENYIKGKLKQMHDHVCRHCRHRFICSSDAAECFRQSIVCDDCWWSVEVKQFLMVLLLLAIAAGMTTLLYRNWQ